MTPSDELFHLVKSLTAHEKRYFKVWASKHVIGKSNHYEKLFDAIDGLADDKPYDEKAFKRLIQSRSFGKNLSEEKSKLTEKILKAMCAYHAGQSDDGRLIDMLHEIRFLYNKGLIKSCTALIERTIKLAQESEQHSLILFVNDYLMSLFTLKKLSGPYTAQSIKENESAMLQQINLTRMAVYLRIRMVEIDTLAQWEKCAAEADSIMEQSTRMAEQNHLTAKAEVAILNTQQFYYLHHQRYEECLDVTSKWLSKYEEDETRYSFLSEPYRLILANYLMSMMMAEKFELMPLAIEKIKAIKTNDEREAAISFRIITQYELIYLLNTSNYEHAEKIITDLESGLDKYKRFLPHGRIVTFRFNISLLHFLQKRYLKSHTSLKEFGDIVARNEKYTNAMAIARSMEWMCQYSLGNFDILDSLLRNLKKFYNDRELKNDFLDAKFALFTAIIKEGGLNPALLASAKKVVTEIEPPSEWTQLKTIIQSWM